MAKIYVSARMKVPRLRLDEFKEEVAKIIQQVKEKDTGTWEYNWFIKNDKSECEIHEGFASSEDAIAHQNNLGETLKVFFEKFGFLYAITIYGDPSQQLLEKIKESGFEITVFSFLQGL
jgi:quinol monooxygenase YgiN